MSIERIFVLKDTHQKLMTEYSHEIKDYLRMYGDDGSDYIRHRQCMMNYHRGAYNVLVELEKHETS